MNIGNLLFKCHPIKIIICLCGIYVIFMVGQYLLWPLTASQNWIGVAKVLSRTPLLEQRVPGLFGECEKPIDLAVSFSSIEMIDLLLDRGADPISCTGKTIIHTAVTRPEILRHLLEGRKLDPNMPSYYKVYGPPIFQIFYLGCNSNKSLEAMTILLENGADPNIAKPESYQPISGYALSQAANRGCVDMVKLLLNHGANPKVIADSIRSYVFQNAVTLNNDTQSQNYRAKREEAVSLIEQASAKRM